MIIEDGKFYFIKDEFFDVFKDYGLMVNKMEIKDYVIFALEIDKKKKLYGLFQYLQSMINIRKFMI